MTHVFWFLLHLWLLGVVVSFGWSFYVNWRKDHHVEKQSVGLLLLQALAWPWDAFKWVKGKFKHK
jgi:hypothetical protein